MVDAAIEIGMAYETALGTGHAPALRGALERIVEDAGAAGDLAARRVRSI